MGALNGVINWEFLDEPLYRWAFFFLALMGMGVAWRGILDLMH